MQARLVAASPGGMLAPQDAMLLMNTPANPRASVGGAMGSQGPAKRLLVRRDAIVLPFVWRGLLPAIGLLVLAGYAVGPFARDAIEAQVLAETRSALDLRGFRWVQIRVDGQVLHLTGQPPVAAAEREAMAAARAVTCMTWAGRHPCAVDVMANFAAPQNANPNVIVPRSAASPVPPTSPPIGATALPSAPAEASSPSVAVAAPAAAIANAVDAARACEQQIAKILATSRIQFETAQAVISTSSAPLLDEIAKTLRGCPGVVRVEGHTDSQGSASKNLALSLDRAFAVRDALVTRGLVPAHVVAEGFGATRPVLSNGTPEGRAANRRIEFRVVPASAR